MPGRAAEAHPCCMLPALHDWQWLGEQKGIEWAEGRDSHRANMMRRALSSPSRAHTYEGERTDAKGRVVVSRDGGL